MKSAEKVNENNKNKINLTLLNGTGYIFEIKDYLYIRRTHHILGATVGTCNVRGWSAHKCTLPIELTPWETQLLLDEDIAVLVSKAEDLLKQPTLADASIYKQEYNQRINEQEQLMKKEKLKECESNIEKIMLGKRKKLIKSGVHEKDIKLDKAEILQEISDKFVYDKKNALIDIPCAHPKLHVGRLCNRKLYDTTCLKYQVFRDFWLRGKFITNGDTFGGDFLLYPGDPLLYHASHIIILLDVPKVYALDLIAKVRLSVAVNKYCVFAYFDKSDNDNENDKNHDGHDNNGREGTKANNLKISYQTIFWEGDTEKQRTQLPITSNASDDCSSSD